MVDKSGKVLAAEPGSPGGTLETAKKVTGGQGSAAAAAAPVAAQEPVTEPGVNGANGAKEDVVQAETAAQVADTAEKIDSTEGKPAEL